MKSIKYEQLQSILNDNVNPLFFIIASDEFFIKQDIIDQLKIYLFNKNYETKFYFDGEDFDWNGLQSTLFSNGLFSLKQQIIINANNKIPKELTQFSHTIAKNAGGDNAVIISFPHLTKQQEKTKWFKELTSNDNCFYISFYPPKGNDLQNWFINKAKNFNIELSNEAINFLSENFDGNLADGYQVLEKLNMQDISGLVSLEDLKNHFRGGNHYLTSDLTDAMLQGQKRKSFKIIKTLFNDGIDLHIIVWTLENDLQLIHKTKEFQNINPYNIDSLFNTPLLKFKKKKYEDFAKNHTMMHINNLIKLFSLIDSNMQKFNIEISWKYVEQYVLMFNDEDYLRRYSSIKIFQ